MYDLSKVFSIGPLERTYQGASLKNTNNKFHITFVEDDGSETMVEMDVINIRWKTLKDKTYAG